MKASTIVYTVWVVFVGLTVAAEVARMQGILINHTESMPMGIWRVAPLERPLRHGDVVSFCPPETEPFRLARERGYIGAGACPGNFEPMLKPVAGVPGDVVAVSEAGVVVNGALLPGSVPTAVDPHGRPLPQLRHTFVLGTGELWLFSNHDPRSFDSRYFGPVKSAQLKGVAVPLWTTK